LGAVVIAGLVVPANIREAYKLTWFKVRYII
jgi:hypothetical protein